MYNYQVELNQASKLDIAHGAIKTLEGIKKIDREVFTLQEILQANNLYGSSWTQMMYVDLLCELHYIRKLRGTYEATQFQQYVKCF